MSLCFENNGPFTTASAPFDQSPTSRDETHKIMLQVEINGLWTRAMLDTASSWLVLSPDIAKELKLMRADDLEERPLTIMGNRVRGYLHRVDLRILSEEGHPVDFVQATAFTPINPHEWGEHWPNVIGYFNCLDRIRFAVDPFKEVFHFGMP